MKNVFHIVMAVEAVFAWLCVGVLSFVDTSTCVFATLLVVAVVATGFLAVSKVLSHVRIS